MTRSQVRAAIRRMRDHVEEIEEEAGELNLVPYMDIVTNIIIFLLASVVNQVALGQHQRVVADHPGWRRPSEDDPSREAAAEPDDHGRRPGYCRRGRREACCRPFRSCPNGQYDYKTLTTKLKEIKTNPDNADETKATFNADAMIPYDIVIATLDAMRQAEDGKILFPDVNFAAGIQ
jgi:biopolymer transport protein ExbD